MRGARVSTWCGLLSCNAGEERRWRVCTSFLPCYRSICCNVLRRSGWYVLSDAIETLLLRPSFQYVATELTLLRKIRCVTTVCEPVSYFTIGAFPMQLRIDSVTTRASKVGQWFDAHSYATRLHSSTPLWPVPTNSCVMAQETRLPLLMSVCCFLILVGTAAIHHSRLPTCAINYLT